MSSTTSNPRHGFPWARAARHLGRALRLRCPNCGGGGLFRQWILLKRSCPRCHLFLDRGEPDHFLGAYVVNFVTAEFIIAFAALGVGWATWPDVPWTALKWGLIALMIPAPFVTYPWARTFWLAIDLIFRPVTLRDLEGHGENATTAESAAR